MRLHVCVCWCAVWVCTWVRRGATLHRARVCTRVQVCMWGMLVGMCVHVCACVHRSLWAVHWVRVHIRVCMRAVHIGLCASTHEVCARVCTFMYLCVHVYACMPA